MAFLVSPGVQVREIDLTDIVPAVSTSIGAYAGHFNWGPIGDVINLSSEKDLARYFGAPSKAMAQSYHLAATFLRYGETLLVSRAIDEDTALNASSGDADGTTTGTDAAKLIRNREDFDQMGVNTVTGCFYARCPGEYGNSLKVMVQPAGVPTRFTISQLEVIDDAYNVSNHKAIKVTVLDPEENLSNGIHVSFRAIRAKNDWVNDLENNESGFYLSNQSDEGDGYWSYILATADTYTESTVIYDPDSVYAANYTGELTPVGETVVIDSPSRGFMYAPPEAEEFETAFADAPGTSVYAQEYGATNDELNVLVIDVDGKFSGTPGSVLERFGNLSAAKDAKKEDGSTIYYKDVINTSSKFIFVDNLDDLIDGADDVIVDDGINTVTTEFSAANNVNGSLWQAQLVGGADGDRSSGNVYNALELFADPETLDLNLIFAENDTEASITIANQLIYIAEKRKDCVAFISPDLEVVEQNTDDAKLDKVLSKFNRLTSTSYAVFDSTPIYVYDKYNDEYIWIAASGSTAGLCARTDIVRDPWWSPAGYNRGQLLGITKLALNPKQNQRDALYKARVNPIVSFPGEGTILFGDKTAQAKPSAFDRINVRRLFIVLEKAISKFAKYQLFEFNDTFTRTQFKNIVDPYLRDIQGRRGITDFLVVCDESNNTGEVIDSNRFVADIYIKPARAINFITLNFVATRTGVEFNEVVGKFG